MYLGQSTRRFIQYMFFPLFFRRIVDMKIYSKVVCGKLWLVRILSRSVESLWPAYNPLQPPSHKHWLTQFSMFMYELVVSEKFDLVSSCQEAAISQKCLSH